MELHTIRKLMEDEGDDREYQSRAVFTEQNFCDDSCKESEPEGHNNNMLLLMKEI
jgi:hypothetical protein